MPPRGPLAHTSTRWRHEGQRQYKPDGMDWTAKSRPAPPSSSRRYHLLERTCPKDGISNQQRVWKEATRLTPKRCWSRLLFFRLVNWHRTLDNKEMEPTVLGEMLSFSVSTRNAEINDVSCWMSIIIFCWFQFSAKVEWLGGASKDMVLGMKKPIRRKKINKY